MIKPDGTINVLAGGDSAITTFNELKQTLKDKHGWLRQLVSGSPSERIINKPALSGAIVLAPGCMEYTGDGTFELYDASQDPLGGDPPMYGCYPLGNNYGTRVTVEAPCVP